MVGRRDRGAFVSRISATDRMSRLIAAIPWIAAQGGVTLAEISERFDYPQAALLEDLESVLLFVGVSPYTPDTLIDVIIDDDMVWIHYADWFARPMKLSGSEILSLLAAGEAALAFDKAEDAGALARGLAKLRLSTGSTEETVDVSFGTVATPALVLLREASTSQQCADIVYQSFSSNERSERRIEPTRFFHEGGRWYVGAYCHLAEAERVFRLDRIESAAASEAPFTMPVPDDASAGTFELDDGPEITISAPVEFAQVFEGVPVHSIETADGNVVVSLSASSSRWIEQLFLRLGPQAQIIAGGPVPDIASAAARVRGRYVD